MKKVTILMAITYLLDEGEDIGGVTNALEDILLEQDGVDDTEVREIFEGR